MTRRLSVNLGLPTVPLTEDSQLFVEFQRVYNAINSLARALDLYTGVVSDPESTWAATGLKNLYAGFNSSFYVEAAEDLTYGTTVSLDGTGKAIKGTSGNVIGFCAAPSTLTGETTKVQVFGALAITSLTPGAWYYASGTAGQIAASGTQKVGFAINSSILYFFPGV